MAEYIERTEFFKHIRKALCSDCHMRKGIKNGKEQFVYEIGEAPCRGCDIDTALDYVDDYPTADVAPVKHGKWMPFLPEYGDMYTCSECQKVTRYFQKKQWIPANLYDYCPNCGARMDGEDEDGNIATDIGCAIRNLGWDSGNMVGDKKIQMTNADRIRAMTDEELAEWIANDLIEPGYYEPGVCKKIWLEWLKKEVDE